MLDTEDELERFREGVRGFLSKALPPEIADRVKAGYYLSKEETLHWHRALARKGWIAPNWPVSYGGTGWSMMQKYIYDEECARAGAPILSGTGLNQVATLLLRFGSDEQRERFLKPLYDGDHSWCQGWSEAGAGSDLSNMKCGAVREGDVYIVNGSKLWTSFAHISEWCMLLVRTGSGARKQEGISVLLMDMSTPGIAVRPIISLDGMHTLNEVFLDNVKVPAANLVGEEGDGWKMMRGIVLDIERISAAGLGRARSYLERLYMVAGGEQRDGKPLIEHPVFGRRLAWLEIRTRALHTMMLDLIATPTAEWGSLPSVLKLRGTALQQDILEMISEAAGYYGVAFHPDALRVGWRDEEPIGPDFATPITPFYLYMRHKTISGGTSETHRNMIAKSALG